MPHGLFDYIDGSFHTMGETPSKQTQGGTGPLCNPATVNKRFSFNFPSGKKWTLSQKDDASARVFYCGGIAEVIPEAQPFVPTGPGKCPDGSDAFSVRGQWMCPSGEGERCGGMSGSRCGAGLECYREDAFSGIMDAPGKCRRISASAGTSGGTSAGSNCPPTTHNEGLIQQAKMMGYNNAFQVRYGSTNIPDPRETFAQFKDCPIYGQLMSAYAEEYNRYLQLFPQLSPIR